MDVYKMVKTLYVVLKQSKIIGVFDDLSRFGEKRGYTIEKFKLNEKNIKPNQIIFKGRDFDISNIDDPLPLLDVSDPSYL
jgi:hypothetical protein